MGDRVDVTPQQSLTAEMMTGLSPLLTRMKSLVMESPPITVPKSNLGLSQWISGAAKT
jgi:hypothetical protein